ncbi:MAG: hypothetical protein LAO21_18220 [Acidobacteriia bacterium]|nr:hypothetical protein [Terriglobia bacterium]
MIRLDRHPTWAGGNPCDGFEAPCGIIYTNHKQIFKDNWYDFAYNIATRYPDVTNWILWNEPNLAENFSPQSPLNPTGLVSEYMDLIQFPGHNAITTAIPSARMIGPDIFTPSGGNEGYTCDYWNHCMNWLSGWTDSLLRYFPSFFETFSIHNYSIDERAQVSAVSKVWNKMVGLGVQRRIWLTEFNYRNGTCSEPEWSIANWTQSLYQKMTWERSFYFVLQDPEGQGCGFGLLYGRQLEFLEKTPLYSRFQQIVAAIP